MKQKEVEDVFGGKEEFANADSMASKCFDSSAVPELLEGPEADVTSFFSLAYSAMPRRELQWRTCILFPAADSECR